MNQNFQHVKLVIFDFDGVFTDNTVYVDQNGIESVRCWRGDGIGLDLLRERGIEFAVVSTETNAVVEQRCKKLGIRCIRGSRDKALAVQSLCEEFKVDTQFVCFLGNDRNDIPALKVVGFPALVSDADSSLKHFDCFRTVARGGFGAVRELCEEIYNATKL